jgi:interleukin-1 receptor-associated kinase 4
MPFLRDKSKVLRLVETRLDGQYSRKGALMLAHVAHRCVNPNAKERPSMQQVVELLEPTVERSYKDMANSPRTHDSAHRQQDQTLQSAQEALNAARSSRDHRRN